MAMIPKAMRVLLGLLLLLGMFVVSATAADPLSGSGSQIVSPHTFRCSNRASKCPNPVACLFSAFR